MQLIGSASGGQLLLPVFSSRLYPEETELTKLCLDYFMTNVKHIEFKVQYCQNNFTPI